MKPACDRFRRRALAALAGVAFAVAPGPGGPRALAAELTLAPIAVTETKAVFGRVETRVVVAARARIGGTLVELSVTEGAAVTAGQIIARVADDKLTLQLRAADARLTGLASELNNARQELERATALVARGVGTQQRVDAARTQVEVLANQIKAAEADRAVLVQQASEGAVMAPAAGRVLTAPLTRGAVVLPGDAVVTIGGGGYYLRVALPERHAAELAVGAAVEIGGREGGEASAGATRAGRIVKVYPQIENGRVIADVEVADLGTFFVGERRPVRVPVATRQVLALPPAAIASRAGLDFVRLRTGTVTREVVVVPGAMVATPQGPMVEILSGLRAGDVVVLP